MKDMSKATTLPYTRYVHIMYSVHTPAQRTMCNTERDTVCVGSNLKLRAGYVLISISQPLIQTSLCSRQNAITLHANRNMRTRVIYTEAL